MCFDGGIARAVAMVATAALCACLSESRLEISVEPNPIPADAGVATVVVSAGGSAKGIRIFATRGQVGPVVVDGQGRATAELTGLTDVADGSVGIQAARGQARAGVVVPVVAGGPVAVEVDVDPPAVSADEGRVRLTIAVVDASGNPIATDDLTVQPSVGVVESVARQSAGVYVATVADLRDRDASPVSIAIDGGGVGTVAEVVILGGEAAAYGFEFDPDDVRAGEPFQLTLHSLDRWGNRRDIFGEVAYVSAYRRSQPLLSVPVSPRTTNLFEGGSVSMSMTVHGWGPDVVLRAAARPVSPEIVSESVDIAIPQPEIGCVRVEPTGLDSRVQPATELGRPGGFPLKIVTSLQTCQDIVDSGERFGARLAGFAPQTYVSLGNGQFWGSSADAEAGGEKVGPVAFNPEDVSYRFNVTGLTNTAWTPVLVTAEVEGKIGAVEIEITPGTWRKLVLSKIPDQYEGLSVDLNVPPFNLPITIQTGFGMTLLGTDLYGNIVGTATGTVGCDLIASNSTAVIGTVLPEATIPLLVGQVNQYLGLALNSSPQVGVDARLSCKLQDSTISGVSNVFRVFPEPDLLTQGQSTDFLVRVMEEQSMPAGFPSQVTGNVTGEIAPKIAGVPFQIEIVARGQGGSFPGGELGVGIPTFAGNVELDALDGDMEIVADENGVALPSAPLTNRMHCQGEPNGGQFTTEELVVFFNLVCDTNPTPGFFTRSYSVVRPWVRILTASDNQVIAVNPAIPSVPLPSLKSSMSFSSGFSSGFQVLPAELAGLRFAAEITAEVQIGQGFPMSIQAVDAFGNVVDESFDLDISDLSGTIWPKTVALIDGEATVTVQVFQAWPNNMVTVRGSDPPLRAQSSVFNVVP